PRATLERIFASGNGGRQRGSELHSAIHALAEQDLDAALAYFAQVTSLEDRQMIGTVIGPLLAARSPSEALAWARANDNHEYPALEQAVLAEIAKKDPQYAIAEAVRSPHANVGFVVANVISQRAMNNPKQALELLEYVENPEQREMAAQQIATQWLRRDAKGAVEWMLSQNDESLRQMVGQSAHALVRHDVDQAMRVLPRLDVDQQQMMRMQIANHLAMNRSPAEAQNFVRQFADQPDYEPLQTAVIAGVARNNLVQARQMAGELLDPDSRNIAYTSIIAVSAARDPQSAVGLLASIGDENQRGAAAGQLASVWYGSDPRAAQQWVSSLPSGNVRDDAVMHLSGHWRNIGSEEQALIDSIGDADKRGQAKVRHIYSLMHTDPARAQQLLQDPDIPDYQRRQVEMAMQRRGFRY
ncbi:MAG: hypothetical protein R3288_12140, partial [Woeseiaceae bacterium]|nr:hypothetical protein [Woeseiaceae bacterium]